MRVNEIRELSGEELEKEIDKTRKELMNLLFQSANKQLTNTSQIKFTRRKIARISTVIQERIVERTTR
jgi:large subunit ribosomal protein L29